METITLNGRVWFVLRDSRDLEQWRTTETHDSFAVPDSYPAIGTMLIDGDEWTFPYYLYLADANALRAILDQP